MHWSFRLPSFSHRRVDYLGKEDSMSGWGGRHFGSGVYVLSICQNVGGRRGKRPSLAGLANPALFRFLPCSCSTAVSTLAPCVSPFQILFEPAALLIKMCCVVQRLEGNNILKHIVLLPASQRAKQNLVFIRLAHN